MLAHALLNELLNVFPILFHVKVCVGANVIANIMLRLH